MSDEEVLAAVLQVIWTCSILIDIAMQSAADANEGLPWKRQPNWPRIEASVARLTAPVAMTWFPTAYRRPLELANTLQIDTLCWPGVLTSAGQDVAWAATRPRTPICKFALLAFLR